MSLHICAVTKSPCQSPLACVKHQDCPNQESLKAMQMLGAYANPIGPSTDPGSNEDSQLKREASELRAEIFGLKTGYQAYERVNAELKAENEALRKAMQIAASRMTDAKTCFDRDFPGEWSGELHLAVAIKEIDAAMGKGEQS